MATSPVFIADTMLEAMRNGLMDHIRGELRKRIIETINPDIDAAIDAACVTFSSRIEANYDAATRGDLLKIIIEKKHSAP